MNNLIENELSEINSKSEGRKIQVLNTIDDQLEGYKKDLVILTRPEGYQKKKMKFQIAMMK